MTEYLKQERAWYVECVREYDTVKFQASVMFDTPDGLRNGLFSTIDTLTEFDGLRVSAQMEPGRDHDPYGFRTEYREVFSVDLDRARSMVKVMTRVEKGLEKRRAEFGYPETWFQYLTAVGGVLGITKYIIVAPNGEKFDTTGERWRRTDAHGVQYWYGDKVKAAKAGQKV